MREFISRILPHNNARCVAPPGELNSGSGTRIIVPSAMRSGTHLLIDLILNNFPPYRRSPLYIDIDQYFKSERSWDDLKTCGSYVIKTHYPWDYVDPQREELFRELAKDGKVLRPVRSADDVWRSLRDFGSCGSREELDHHLNSQEEFWSRFDVLEVPFEGMTNPESADTLLERIAEFIEMPMPGRPVLPRPRSQTRRVLCDKFLTRLLGTRAPRINTTVRFARTAPSR